MPAPELLTPRPAEERSYLAFSAVALSLTLGAGLTLAILIAAGEAGSPSLAARLPRLIQAHGWTQLEGWLGLFVAGMGLRLVPRFTGRRPLPTPITISILVLLAAGVLLRLIAQAALDGPAVPTLLLAAALLSGAGATLLAGALGVALLARGRRWQAWRLAAWSGTFWWLAWAVLTGFGAFFERAGVVPSWLDEPAVWVMLLGVLSNFAWAVQARTVPVFYGRRPPGTLQLSPPLVLLNAGVALAAVAPLGVPGLDTGLAIAGMGTIWLAPLAGSVWGNAGRLRPASRAAARFIVAANLWAAGAGLVLVAAAANPGRAEALRDAALHATGLGFMTTLIVGMAQLVMPAFAGQRAAPGRQGPVSWLSWPALMLAATLRVVGALTAGRAGAAAIALSGVLAWIALAAFAAGLLGAALRLSRPKSSAAAASG